MIRKGNVKKEEKARSNNFKVSFYAGTNLTNFKTNHKFYLVCENDKVTGQGNCGNCSAHNLNFLISEPLCDSR